LFLGASSHCLLTLFDVSQTLILTLRLLSGYSFVADRLKSGVVYFETDERKPRSEMGLTRLGYERQGDMWVKPEEVSKRDRLIW
jgi:hypothetical protein